MAYGSKISQPLGLALAAFGAVGLLFAALTMRLPDMAQAPDCAKLPVTLPNDETTVAVAARDQVLRVNQQVCIWWRPGKYFATEVDAKDLRKTVLDTALKDEALARQALADALAKTPYDAADATAKRTQLEARMTVRKAAEAEVAAVQNTATVTLFIDDDATPVSFPAWISDDQTWRAMSHKLHVPHTATGDDPANWRRLLSVDGTGSRMVQLGLGDAADKLPRAPVGAAKLKLDVYTPFGLVVGVGALLALMAGFIIAGWDTGMLRDTKPTAADPDPPFSLGRAQLALWLLLALGGFLFVWMVSGQFIGVFTTSIVALLGISGVSSAAAAAVDSAHAPAQAAARAAGAPAPHSRGFFRDLISDGEGDMVLHRVQMVVWSLVLGVIFVLTVWRTYAFPDFDNTLVVLAGVVGGVYVSLKIPEKP